LDEKLSNVDFVVVVNIMRWQKTSGLANQSSPTLTTPKCIIKQKIIIKVSFLHSYVNEPFPCHVRFVRKTKNTNWLKG